jgi:hypothetical protein
MPSDLERLRVLLPHWLEHNGDHADEFRRWASRAGPAEGHLLTAAERVDAVAEALRAALETLQEPKGEC